MNTTLDYLRDRTDPRVVVAKTRLCTICKAEPGQDCTNPGKVPQLGRVVHLCRVQAHMDQRKATE